MTLCGVALSGNGNVTLNTLDLMASRMEISPLLLLSDQYDSQELESSFLPLRTLDCFCALSRENRAKAAALFCELIELLAKADGDSKKEEQSPPPPLLKQINKK